MLKSLVPRTLTKCLFAAVVWMGSLPTAHGYYSNGRWSQTATDGVTAPLGRPATVTWSIVPDGTSIPGRGPSNLVAFMDELYGGGSGAINLRPWFPLLEASFDRWTELGGLTFAYEPNDDGITHGNFAGALGTRGDVRLAGVFIDGPGNTNAVTGFLDRADITIDTGDPGYYGDGAANSLNFRNTLTHEVGHAFGLGHVDASSAAFLMEPFSDNSFDGPQLDDIRGLQYLYGDAWERGAGGSNDDFGSATALGELTFGTSVTLGLDAATGTAVLATETDFVSIANQDDADVFSFTVPGTAAVDITVTPTGPNYIERPTGIGSYATTRSSRISDLSMELYASDGEAPLLIAAAAAAPLGQPESLAGVGVDGSHTYYVRIVGDASDVQLYHLSLTAIGASGAGDFDDNGHVDGGDLLSWQRGFPATYSAADLTDWQTAFGMPAPASAASVPAPSAERLAAIAICVLGLRRRASGMRIWA